MELKEVEVTIKSHTMRVGQVKLEVMEQLGMRDGYAGESYDEGVAADLSLIVRTPSGAQVVLSDSMTVEAATLWQRRHHVSLHEAIALTDADVEAIVARYEEQLEAGLVGASVRGEMGNVEDTVVRAALEADAKEAKERGEAMAYWRRARSKKVPGLREARILAQYDHTEKKVVRRLALLEETLEGGCKSQLERVRRGGGKAGKDGGPAKLVDLTSTSAVAKALATKKPRSVTKQLARGDGGGGGGEGSGRALYEVVRGGAEKQDGHLEGKAIDSQIRRVQKEGDDLNAFVGGDVDSEASQAFVADMHQTVKREKDAIYAALRGKLPSSLSDITAYFHSEFDFHEMHTGLLAIQALHGEVDQDGLVEILDGVDWDGAGDALDSAVAFAARYPDGVFGEGEDDEDEDDSEGGGKKKKKKKKNQDPIAKVLSEHDWQEVKEAVDAVSRVDKKSMDTGVLDDIADHHDWESVTDAALALRQYQAMGAARRLNSVGRRASAAEKDAEGVLSPHLHWDDVHVALVVASILCSAQLDDRHCDAIIHMVDMGHWDEAARAAKHIAHLVEAEDTKAPATKALKKHNWHQVSEAFRAASGLSKALKVKEANGGAAPEDAVDGDETKTAAGGAAGAGGDGAHDGHPSAQSWAKAQTWTKVAEATKSLEAWCGGHHTRVDDVGEFLDHIQRVFMHRLMPDTARGDPYGAPGAADASVHTAARDKYQPKATARAAGGAPGAAEGGAGGEAGMWTEVDGIVEEVKEDSNAAAGAGAGTGAGAGAGAGAASEDSAAAKGTDGKVKDEAAKKPKKKSMIGGMFGVAKIKGMFKRNRAKKEATEGAGEEKKDGKDGGDGGDGGGAKVDHKTSYQDEKTPDKGGAGGRGGRGDDRDDGYNHDDGGDGDYSDDSHNGGPYADGDNRSAGGTPTSRTPTVNLSKSGGYESHDEDGGDGRGGAMGGDDYGVEIYSDDSSDVQNGKLKEREKRRKAAGGAAAPPTNRTGKATADDPYDDDDDEEGSYYSDRDAVVRSPGSGQGSAAKDRRPSRATNVARSKGLALGEGEGGGGGGSDSEDEAARHEKGGRDADYAADDIEELSGHDDDHGACMSEWAQE